MKMLSMIILTSAFIMTGFCVGNAEEKLTGENVAAKLTKVEGTTPAQWRVIWNGDASTQATISWSTAEEGKSHTLHYGTKAHGTDADKYEFQQACQRNGMYTQGKKTAPDAFYHHATIKNLKPSTTYYFVMKSDDSVSKQLYFITAPEKGTGFSIIYGGDSRSNFLPRVQINLMISDMVAKDPSILALIHGGDFVGTGALRWWRAWMSFNELTTAPDGRVLPIIATRGNHDGGPVFKEIFNIEENQPDWYTVTFGKDVAVVTLNTNAAGGGDQAAWLEGELKRLRPQTKWLVTNYHRPLFPAVKKRPPHSHIWVPLFEKYNVDLACESDGHCIKRTVPIRDGKKDPTGVTYIGEGGFGVRQRDPKGDHWYLKDGGIVGKGHHVMRLDFTDDTLRIRTILLGGKVFDDHSLKVRK